MGNRPIRQVASATKVRGRLDVVALEEALSALMDRHEALRTQILNVDGEPVQELKTHNPAPLEVVDLSEAPTHERSRIIQQQIARTIKDLSDYALDPLFRLIFLRLGANESVVVIATDHTISDGASLCILLDDLLTMHEELNNGHSISLPPVRMQLSDYALWQRTELAGVLQSHAHDYEGWARTRFPGAPSIDGRPGWGTVSFVFESRLKNALTDWARNRGTSQVMAALTAYVALVLRWCDVSETLIQVMSDGRLSKELENTVGYVAFPYYVYISIGSRATFMELMQTIQTAYCRACEQPDFYYSYIRTPRPEFTASTYFNWLPRRASAEARSEVGRHRLFECTSVSYENPLFETLDLDVEPGVLLKETDTEIVGRVGFPLKKFSIRYMSQFAARYKNVLQLLIREPVSRVFDARV